jgi:tetratricopeptide (TPR) repeat protein
VRGQAGGDTTLSLSAGEAEKLLRALLQEEPDEPRALLASGILYRNTGRFPECREALNRMVRNPAFAVQAWNELGWAEYYAGDYTAAGVAIDHSIALQGFWGNLALKQILAQWWLGDLDLAKSAQDRMPVAARQEDIGIYSAAELAYWRREPEAMLQILDGVPRDWLQSNGFTGPTAWYAGLAHRMAGRAAAAQLQWRTALAVVERRLDAQTDSAFLIHWKGTLLAALDKRDEAEPVLKLAREMRARRSDTRDDFLALVLMGELDHAIDVLERRADERRASATAAAYRLHPNFDPLRALPRFQALLSRMEADPRFSPNANQRTENGRQRSDSDLPARPELAERATRSSLATPRWPDQCSDTPFGDQEADVVEGLGNAIKER